MLWSGGKDSSVMMHLVKKAFNGNIPFKTMHIDTGYKIAEILKFRDKIISNNKYDNLVCKNLECDKYSECSIDCCINLKSKPLNDLIYNTNKYYKYSIIDNQYIEAIQNYPIKGLFLGIRGDEESTRSKESFFSKRYTDKWKVDDDILELWGNYNYDYDDESHIRIHPLLRWTELDVWEYIKYENIEYIDLYLSNNKERYRTIGCGRCTNKIKSNANNIDEIISELKTTLVDIKERDTRNQDKKDNGSLEILRTNGYM